MIKTELTNLESYKKYARYDKKLKGISQAENLNFVVKSNSQGYIALGVESLEKCFNDDNYIQKMGLQDNSKLGEIPTIAFPNIFEQMQFMSLVNANKDLLNYGSIKILKDYFDEYKVCVNCGSCFGSCYNNSDIQQYPSKVISDLKNLLMYITKKEELKEQLIKKLRVYNTFRINSNGEIHSMEMLEFWLDIASKCKKTNFYTYTKSYEIFEEYLSNGNKIPKNFVLNISIMSDEQNEEIKKNFPNLYNRFNKFLVLAPSVLDAKLKSKEIKKNRICSGDCMACNLCQKNLPKANSVIFVYRHI